MPDHHLIQFSTCEVTAAGQYRAVMNIETPRAQAGVEGAM